MRRLKRLLFLLVTLLVISACVDRYIVRREPRLLVSGLPPIRIELTYGPAPKTEITWTSNHSILLFRPTVDHTNTGLSDLSRSPQWSVEQIDTASGVRKAVPFAAKPTAYAEQFIASPDGRYLAWEDEDHPGTGSSDGHIYVSAPDGAHAHMAPGTGKIYGDYHWMPDSLHILGWPYDGDSLFSYSINGGTPQRIPLVVPYPAGMRQTAPHPEMTDERVAGKGVIYNLADDLKGSMNNPIWPENPYIANLSTYDARTGKRIRCTAFRMPGVHGFVGWDLQWSLAPDGRRFAVVVNHEDDSVLTRLCRWQHIKRRPRTVQSLLIYGPGPREVREVYSLEAKLPGRLTASAQMKALVERTYFINSPCWSPDGKQIAFIANGSLYVAPTE